jgi:hypothetical protein
MTARDGNRARTRFDLPAIVLADAAIGEARLEARPERDRPIRELANAVTCGTPRLVVCPAAGRLA